MNSDRIVRPDFYNENGRGLVAIYLSLYTASHLSRVLCAACASVHIKKLCWKDSVKFKMLKDIEPYLQLKGSNLWFGVVQGGDGSLALVNQRNLRIIWRILPFLNMSNCVRHRFNVAKSIHKFFYKHFELWRVSPMNWLEPVRHFVRQVRTENY